MTYIDILPRELRLILEEQVNAWNCLSSFLSIFSVCPPYANKYDCEDFDKWTNKLIEKFPVYFEKREHIILDCKQVTLILPIERTITKEILLKIFYTIYMHSYAYKKCKFKRLINKWLLEFKYKERIVIIKCCPNDIINIIEI